MEFSGESKTVFTPSRLGWIVLSVVILAVVIIPSFYFYNQYRKAQLLLQNPNASAVAEGKAVVEAVGKLIVLPANEDPTIATVSDAAKLSDQQFFARAQNGDKVLVYKNAKELILYRPSLNKIINIATLNTVSASQIPAAVPAPTPSPVLTASPASSLTPTASPIRTQ